MADQRVDITSTKYDMLERTSEYNRGHALAMEVAGTTEVVDPHDEEGEVK